jgi:hypothetical protein
MPMIGHRPLLAFDHSFFMTLSLPATGGCREPTILSTLPSLVLGEDDCGIPDATSALPRKATADAVGQA